jgi:hypothetical protein
MSSSVPPNSGEIGQDAADEARELEAVPAARRGDDHVDAARQGAEPEMVVGRQGVEADLGMVDRGLGQRGEVAEEGAADDRKMTCGTKRCAFGSQQRMIKR